ncbi:dTDP-4-dehydrorhamnose 3,5-epimerase family protein [Pigmentibacter ruber]|uniref:dTDP-4-dehydrorhamnose 3,5-epimerase family protein n=1 Tax=Pigmentibacter ruber TaxID=2683196 RepID=UPI00131B214C|nr:dTDP-4-dehydrorhamnose 3,5-epimerase family protein [Pigmentibacter ruber]BFD31225.1 dTDP-4-dehydrorhamnose 3,5-epimerase family protein [Pigmentibacter ruber]
MSNISGVLIQELKQFTNEKGKVFHMLRADSPSFIAFGEVYFSQINPGKIKGWHKQLIKTINYAVPVGKVKLVLYDARENNSTYKNILEITLSQDEYYLVTIPPGIWVSFKAISDTIALLVNCATHPHSEKECEYVAIEDNLIPYNWDK